MPRRSPFSNLAAVAFLLGSLQPSHLTAADPEIIAPLRDSYPSLSPDGQRIVFQSNRDGSNQIWVMQRDGSGLLKLTGFDGDGAESPAWSPDGQSIVFSAYLGEGDSEVFVMAADGSDLRQVTRGPGYDDHPHWSFDGRRIVFNSDRDTPDPGLPWHQRWHDIWSVAADGSEPVKHTDCRTVCTFGSLSPDGKQLLYRRVDDSTGLDWALEAGLRNSEVYVQNLADGTSINLSRHPAFDGWPAWSPDGQWILFASNRQGPPLVGQLWLIRSDGTDLQQFSHGDWGHVQPAWNADGTLILAYRHQEIGPVEYGGIVVLPREN